MNFTFISIMLTKTLLSGLLLIASLAKLTSPSQSMSLLGQFGINARLLSLIALSLSAVELIIAASLFFAKTSAIAFIFAALIFGISFVFIVVSLHRGSNASCGCFGQFTKEPIKQLTAIRTGFLFLAASITGIAILLTDASPITDHRVTYAAFIGAFFAVAGTLLVVVDIRVHETKHARKLFNSDHLLLGRREVLTGLGAIVLSLFSQRWLGKAEASSCCHCQKYDHYEPGCCDIYAEKRIFHHFQRCCNTCTGVNGYWRKYAPDTCVYSCDCYASCDVLYGCSGSNCHCNDCGCCL